MKVDTDKMVNEFIEAQNKQNELLKKINNKEINQLKEHSENNVLIDETKKRNNKILENVHSAFKNRFNALKVSKDNNMSNKELIKASFNFIRLDLGSDIHKQTEKIISILEFYYTSKFFAKNNITFKMLTNLKSLNKFITQSAFESVYTPVLLDEKMEQELWEKAKNLKKFYNMGKKELTISDLAIISQHLHGILTVDIEKATYKLNLQNFNRVSSADFKSVFTQIELARYEKIPLKESFTINITPAKITV